MEKEKVIAVLKGQPSWQPLVTKIILGITGFLILLAIYTALFNDDPSPTVMFYTSFHIIFLFAVAGLALLIRKKTFLDLKNNRYKEEFSLGWIKRGEWKLLPQLDYVAVFSYEPKHFDINLWYGYNKHLKIFTFKDEHRAFDLACRIALEQNIKLLNATTKGNKYYVDLQEFSKKYGYDSAQEATS